MRRVNRIVKSMFSLGMAFMLTACGVKSANLSDTSKEDSETFNAQASIRMDSDKEENDTPEPSSSIVSLPDTSETVDSDTNATDALNTYVSADNFWQDTGYFDLEGFLEANAPTYVKKGRWKEDASGFEERTDVASVYKAQFAHPNWMVYVAPPVTVWFLYMGYREDGEIIFFPEYLAVQSKPVEEQRNVTINEFGVQMSDTAIQTLDHMIYLMKAHPDEDDPFQYNEHTDIFIAPKSSNEYPGEIDQKNTNEKQTTEIVLPNQDDFWHLNYFDLLGYLDACGADRVEPQIEDNLGPLPDAYRAWFGDYYIDIYTTNYGDWPNISLYNEKLQDGTFYVFDGKPHTENIILIDDQNFTKQAVIEALDGVIRELLRIKDEDVSKLPVIDGFFY